MNLDKILIVIPARYASKRLPGKPLQKIAGMEMIQRVALIAAAVCNKNSICNYIIATDDFRIVNFCNQNKLPVTMTSEHCKSGTERCWDVVNSMEFPPNFIINLQGDNPLCPPWFIEQLIDAWQNDTEAQVFTSCAQLSWDELERLEQMKLTTPFSGTTVLVNHKGHALAFSKRIIPAIRNKAKLMQTDTLSPVRRHIGLYAYTFDALKNYFQLTPSYYEEAEGLEQMRFLHHCIPIKLVEVDYRGRLSMSGVDSPEDIERAENIIAQFGEFI